MKEAVEMSVIIILSFTNIPSLLVMFTLTCHRDVVILNIEDKSRCQVWAMCFPGLAFVCMTPSMLSVFMQT